MFNKKPKYWRIGQTIFNFLWFLQKRGHTTEWSSEIGQLHGRIADPLYIIDKKLKKFYKSFLEEYDTTS